MNDPAMLCEHNFVPYRAFFRRDRWLCVRPAITTRWTTRCNARFTRTCRSLCAASTPRNGGTMSDDLDLPALRAKCEAAHAGPWFCEPVEQDGGIIDAIHEPDIARSIWLHDAEFIAAANPSVVAALIDENERLRAEHAKCHDTHQRMVRVVEFRTARMDAALAETWTVAVRAEQAETALARVRGLCDEADRMDADQEAYDGTHLLPVVQIDAVRAVIEAAITESERASGDDRRRTSVAVSLLGLLAVPEVPNDRRSED